MNKERNDLMLIERETLLFTTLTLFLGLFVILVIGMIAASS